MGAATGCGAALALPRAEDCVVEANTEAVVAGEVTLSATVGSTRISRRRAASAGSLGAEATVAPAEAEPAPPSRSAIAAATPRPAATSAPITKTGVRDAGVAGAA